MKQEFLDNSPKTRLLHADPAFLRQLEGRGLLSIDALSAKEAGRPATTGRTSWVREIQFEGRRVFVKTYVYPKLSDQRRGMFRNTFAARSRVRKEWEATQWLQARSLNSPNTLLVAERRNYGMLNKAVIVTEAVEGRGADVTLREMSREQGEELIAEIKRSAALWHALGFRDPNLDLRNLIVNREGEHWNVTKIDSPRWYTASRWGGERQAQKDRSRLQRDIASEGFG